MSLLPVSLFETEPRASKKAAIIGVHVSLLAKLLKLPKGIESTTVHYDPRTEELLIRVAGEGLPDECLLHHSCQLQKLNVCLKLTNGVTMNDAPREVQYIEFDRFC